jgi:hypothetical protein
VCQSLGRFLQFDFEGGVLELNGLSRGEVWGSLGIVVFFLTAKRNRNLYMRDRLQLMVESHLEPCLTGFLGIAAG